MKKSLISILFLFVLGTITNTQLYANNSGNGDFVFEFTVETGDESFTVTGESELMMTHTSYTLTMGSEGVGRCVIHMLNFSTAPGPGSYEVQNREDVRTAMVCLIESVEPVERLASHSGNFTITAIKNDYLKGHFEMMLTGPVSGNEFRIHGTVTSKNLSVDIQSDRNPFIRN